MEKGVADAEKKHRLRNRLEKNSNEAESDSLSKQSPALQKYLPPHPLTLNLRIEMKRWKFVVSATKMISYVFFIGFAMWALQGQSKWLWDSTVWHHTFVHVPWRMKTLYFMETAFYLYTLVTMFFEPKMKDRGQMVSHHIFTIILLVSSYAWYFLIFGLIP
jgi:hypothetical protein